jgi:hypothetical protein
MPTAVLMITGQIAVMKITKIADGALSPEGGERDGQPGQRWHGAQHLEDRVEAAHGPLAQSDQRAKRHADDGREPEADGDALQAREHAPAQPDVLRPEHEPRIDDQVLGVLPDLERGRQRRLGPRGRDLPDQQQEREHDDGRHDDRNGLPRHRLQPVELPGALGQAHDRCGSRQERRLPDGCDAFRGDGAQSHARVLRNRGCCQRDGTQTTARLIESDFRYAM